MLVQLSVGMSTLLKVWFNYGVIVSLMQLSSRIEYNIAGLMQSLIVEIHRLIII